MLIILYEELVIHAMGRERLWGFTVLVTSSFNRVRLLVLNIFSSGHDGNLNLLIGVILCCVGLEDNLSYRSHAVTR